MSGRIRAEIISTVGGEIIEKGKDWTAAAAMVISGRRTPSRPARPKENNKVKSLDRIEKKSGMNSFDLDLRRADGLPHVHAAYVVQLC